MSSLFKKNVIHVIEYFIALVDTKFQADIIFGSHLTALKKMLTTWWVNCTDPFRPRCWHHDAFYECLRTSIVIVRMNFDFNKVLAMYLFKCILYFPIQTTDRIFVVERKIDHLWPELDYITYALSPENWEIQSWDQL